MKSAVSLLFVLFHVAVAAEEAYLVIDATVIPASAKQPTWIALSDRGRLIHVPASESIVPIKPGHYWVKHIDFGKSDLSASGTVSSEPAPGFFRINAIANAITHVGVIELKRERRRSSRTDYTTNVRVSSELLRRACNKSPEVFLRFPLTYVDDAGELKSKRVRCET